MGGSLIIEGKEKTFFVSKFANLNGNHVGYLDFLMLFAPFLARNSGGEFSKQISYWWKVLQICFILFRFLRKATGGLSGVRRIKTEKRREAETSDRRLLKYPHRRKWNRRRKQQRAFWRIWNRRQPEKRSPQQRLSIPHITIQFFLFIFFENNMLTFFVCYFLPRCVCVQTRRKKQLFQTRIEEGNLHL